MTYSEVVKALESLSIMPKTMPGLEKLRQALQHKPWFSKLDPEKIITVAGTNGKGTTSAALEALLMSAKQSVGLFTSPHLVSTTERIRINSEPISEEQFIQIYLENKILITESQLTHFESLTLMAADYFFGHKNLDYVIFEVGLGGTYDATNIFPNRFSIITALGLDHQNILGNTIEEIAKNKFGIVKNNSKVIHHALPAAVSEQFRHLIDFTESVAIPAKKGKLICEKSFDPKWFLETQWGKTETNLPGIRACENIMTALTAFAEMGFDPPLHLQALNHIQWQGRMQKILWPGLAAPVYLSGDHNVQGVQSLIDLLQYYEWNELHLVVGIGVDKAADEIFKMLMKLPRVKIYLTKTPFKGRGLSDYPTSVREVAVAENENPIELLKSIKAKPNDIILVTGSLYLVGEILTHK